MEENGTSLNTFHTFHLLLIVGGVALRRSLSSAKEKETRVIPLEKEEGRRREEGTAWIVGSHLDSVRRIVHDRALRLLGGKQRI